LQNRNKHWIVNLHQMQDLTEKEHKERITKVIDYIFKNINSDVSLVRLSTVANYSQFHFQKIFKQLIGKTPKHFIIELKLEIAFHLIIAHPHKSIFEIALDCGFSSSSVFSRSFKKFYNTSPEYFRKLPPKQKHNQSNLFHPNPLTRKGRNLQINSPVTVKTSDSTKGIYLLAPLQNYTKIQQAFKKLIQFAKNNELYSAATKVYGILSPHHGHTYMVFISLPNFDGLSSKLNTIEIGNGKYASINLHGNSDETIKAVHNVFHNWIPESGYKIANRILAFESFLEDPALTPYTKLQRQLHIPIERT
jgi:AraC family transcriptional regulator